MELGGRCYFRCSLFLFSCLLSTSFLLWISAQYKWPRHGFLPPPEISEVEVEFPPTPDPQKDYHMVLVGCGTHGFVH